MTFVREDFYIRLQALTHPQELRDTLLDAARALGFDAFCHGLRLPVPVSQRPVHFVENYPSGWIQHYREAGYLGIDPVVRLGARSPVALVWSSSLFCEAPRLWRDAQDVGLRHGLSQSSWAAQGTFGVLSLARGHDPVTLTEARQLAEPLAWLANLTHLAMQRLFGPGPAHGMSAPLTLREQEVLRWVGEGKTAGEIGQILDISPRTVNFHIYNAQDKLAASNKMQAVVKAFSLGLIA